MKDWLVVIKLIVLLLSWWREKDAAEKKRKAEALKMATEGMAEDDISKINAAIARLKKK
jgi:hypothetical protein